MDANNENLRTERLRFGFGETQLGTVLVALSNRGVAAILLGSDRRKLQAELTDAFAADAFAADPLANVQLVEDETGLAEPIAKVVALVNTPRLGLDLPLDPRGSELQMAVWKALRTIPPGETRTYGALAAALPTLATAQEVGAACAANLLAVAIPCHRVVKADGSISGYRWGAHRKRRLINMEAVA